MTTYSLNLYESDGTLLTVIPNFISLKFAYAESTTGELTLQLDNTNLDSSMLNVDRILEVWREIPGQPPYLEGDRLWYIRKWKFNSVSNSDKLLMTVEASDANHILERAIIKASEETTSAAKTGLSDDIAKEYVRQTLGSTASAGRDRRPYLDVDVDVSAGVTVDVDGSHQVIQDILEGIVEEAYNQGTYMVYDCVRTAPGESLFTTYIGQRGTDHGSTSGDIRLFSIETGNLSGAQLVYDFTKTKNYLYVGGSGRQDAREYVEVSDATSIGRSVINRCEAWINAGGSFRTTEKIRKYGRKQLAKLRDKAQFSGNLNDIPSQRYGVDYYFGDIVACQFAGVTVDCHIDAVSIDVSGGKETISISVTGNVP